VIGAVLAGGASVRFGSDKAVADWFGMPLASHPMRALYGAGARQLVYVAARRRADDTFVMPPGAHAPTHVTDECPGEGPLGAIVTVLRAMRDVLPADDVMIVAACDLPNVTSSTVASMVNALRASSVDLVVPRAAGRLHWSLLALRRSTCVESLTDEFERGERAIHRAVATLSRVELDVDERLLVNVNDRRLLPVTSTDR
jgi:molybdopterin-guanine dinucleotide biosynthesis protein A